MSLIIGTAFCDQKYLIQEELAEGTFAKVYRIVDQFGESFALKAVKKENLNPRQYQMIMEEGILHQELSHPNIIKLFDFFEKEDYIFFILEYAENGELFERMENGPIPEEQAHKYFSQLIQGINYLHQKNIIHGDIKLENILLTSDDSIKLCDFGYAKEGKDFTGIFGTPEYMSPEMLIGDPLSNKLDIWAAGIVLYEIVCGNPLFEEDQPSDVFRKILSFHKKIEFGSAKENISDLVKDLIDLMINPDPDLRISCTQVCDHPWIKYPPKINDKRQLMKKTQSIPCLKLPLEKIRQQQLLAQSSFDELETVMSGRTTTTNINKDNTPITPKSTKSSNKINDEETESLTIRPRSSSTPSIPQIDKTLESVVDNSDVVVGVGVVIDVVGGSRSGSRIGRSRGGSTIRRKSGRSTTSSSPGGSRIGSLRSKSYGGSRESSRSSSPREFKKTSSPMSPRGGSKRRRKKRKHYNRDELEEIMILFRKENDFSNFKTLKTMFHKFKDKATSSKAKKS